EPVEHPLGEVHVQALGDVQGDEQHVHHEHAREHELQVRAPVARDRAAEHEREQQHEHDRLETEVAELPRVVPDLDHRAPRQRKALSQAFHRIYPGSELPRPGSGRADGGHAALPSEPSFSPAGLPVRDRNTSLRLELRSASSVTTTPASSSRRTTVGSTAGSATCAVTNCPLISGAVAASSATTAVTTPSCVSSAGRTARVCAPVLALSWSGVPVAITLPWLMTTISSASSSASSRYCVVSSTVVPPATIRRINPHSSTRARGSSPVVGSSR